MSNTQRVNECIRYAEPWYFTVEQVGDTWEAMLPFRQIVAQGDSREEAIANLAQWYCELARSGAFNPSNPGQVGAQPIQHAIEILAEHLAVRVERRGFELANSKAGELPEVLPRDNEVISGLGTAIAALARIKEL